MADPNVSYSRRGRLAVITLRRPEALNAITLEMVAEVERLALAAEADAEVFAICITGEGRGFCAGLDMNVLAQHAAGNAPKPVERPADKPRKPALFSYLMDISKPVIAAVNGVAAGGGFVLAMMCDLRFVAEDATLITIFSRRGLIAEHGTSWLLPRMVGMSRAMDLLWSSRRVDAAEAYRIGFADRVVPKDQLVDAVETYVADMAASVSSRSLAVIKAAVHRHAALSFDEAALETEDLIAASLAHPDATEGAAHFVEKRAPKFAPWTGN